MTSQSVDDDTAFRDKEDKLETCHICKDPADFGCADCVSGFFPSGTPMCEGCATKHSKLKRFNNHTIISVTELKANKANMKRAPEGVSKICTCMC